jgi:ATP-dependent DNA helicase RecG
VQDGFTLAEKDLELRGPGEFFGTHQSGLPELRVAKLTNLRVVETVRREATALFSRDRGLERPEHRVLKEQIARMWSRCAEWS